MTKISRIAWALLIVAWGLALGPGCGWIWSEQPLVVVTEDTCDGWLSLVEWGHDEGPNRQIIQDLSAGDCVEGFNLARWHDLYLWCQAAPLTDATSGLILPAFGSRAAMLRDSCRRIIDVSVP